MTLQNSKAIISASGIKGIGCVTVIFYRYINEDSKVLQFTSFTVGLQLFLYVPNVMDLGFNLPVNTSEAWFYL